MAISFGAVLLAAAAVAAAVFAVSVVSQAVAAVVVVAAVAAVVVAEVPSNAAAVAFATYSFTRPSFRERLVLPREGSFVHFAPPTWNSSLLNRAKVPDWSATAPS